MLSFSEFTDNEIRLKDKQFYEDPERIPRKLIINGEIPSNTILRVLSRISGPVNYVKF